MPLAPFSGFSLRPPYTLPTTAIPTCACRLPDSLAVPTLFVPTPIAERLRSNNSRRAVDSFQKYERF